MSAARVRVYFLFLGLCVSILILKMHSKVNNYFNYRMIFFMKHRHSLLYNSFSTSASVLNVNQKQLVNVSVAYDLGEKLNKTDMQANSGGKPDIRYGTEWKSNFTDKKILIALYRFYHRLIKSHRNKLNLSKCIHYQNCETVYIKKLTRGFINADAVLIQGNNIPRIFPHHRDDKQVFVFVSVESPVYVRFTNAGSKRFHHYFNWTMTYRTDSDIKYLYGSVVSNDTIRNTLFKKMESDNDSERNWDPTVANFEKISDIGIVNKNYSDIFRKKTGTALWFVSHCHTSSKRESYVHEMTKFTNVTQIGRCSTNKFSACPKKEKCEIAFVKDYKFYLAFENTFCIDYITEKAFKWFDKDIIIVTRGSRNYNKFLPKGTFIDTNDFESAKSLAIYLNKLGSDEERYTRILKLKDHFKVIAEQEHAQIAYCNLCYKLNNLNQYRKSIKNVDEWWLKNACVKSKHMVTLK